MALLFLTHLRISEYFQKEMKIQGKADFIQTIRDFDIETEYVIIKPNWVTNNKGFFTEAEILRWLCQALPEQKKIIVESYTPWRGLIYQPRWEGDDLKVDLEGGKDYWDFYRELDREFLRETGIADALAEFEVEYVNVTECVWDRRCVSHNIIESEIERQGYRLVHTDFYAYVPERLFEIRNQATFISLAKIKLQASGPLGFSLSIKNLYGMLPHPSRRKFHPPENENAGLAESLRDIFMLYRLLFRESLWINEGMLTLLRDYFGENQRVEEGSNVLFVGRDPLQVDAETCSEFGIEPRQSSYYPLIEESVKRLKHIQ